MEEFGVTVVGDGSRLDTFLAKELSESRMFIKHQILDGHVSVNGKLERKASFRLMEGDLVTGFLVAPESYNLEPSEGELDILYEDDDIMVLNKPQGLVVHPAQGHYTDTLVHRILFYLHDNSEFLQSEPERPGIVHRLDKGTSGIICIAKHRRSLEKLSASFKNREVDKEYAAIVWGVPTLEGSVDTPIGRDVSNRKKMSSRSTSLKPALTHWKVEETFRHFTWLKVFPHTGRTHQIRVHLSEIGFPIVGDPMYGKGLSGKRKEMEIETAAHIESLEHTLLHARRITFPHPTLEESMSFEVPAPAVFLKTITLLRQKDPPKEK